jgi:hypothetical protein
LFGALWHNGALDKMKTHGGSPIKDDRIGGDDGLCWLNLLKKLVISKTLFNRLTGLLFLFQSSL